MEGGGASVGLSSSKVVFPMYEYRESLLYNPNVVVEIVLVSVGVGGTVDVTVCGGIGGTVEVTILVCAGVAVRVTISVCIGDVHRKLEKPNY